MSVRAQVLGSRCEGAGRGRHPGGRCRGLLGRVEEGGREGWQGQGRRLILGRAPAQALTRRVRAHSKRAHVARPLRPHTSALTSPPVRSPSGLSRSAKVALALLMVAPVVSTWRRNRAQRGRRTLPTRRQQQGIRCIDARGGSGLCPDSLSPRAPLLCALSALTARAPSRPRQRCRADDSAGRGTTHPMSLSPSPPTLSASRTPPRCATLLALSLL